MKFTLCITNQCNLACRYCYIGKRPARMSPDVAEKAIDFVYRTTPAGEKASIGFFGGEPLLEFGLIREITDMIEHHPRYEPNRIDVDIVTNGTIFSQDIVDFIRDHDIGLGVSCDGPPEVQDTFRRFRESGEGTSSLVETTIVSALKAFPRLIVNSVHHPATIEFLPDVINYFSSLGLRRIYLNPDYSAEWSEKDMQKLSEAYEAAGRLFIEFYRRGDPHYISIIDGKIAVILRGGYEPRERCRMGKAEFAISPEGNIYPCERIMGDGAGGDHCIGSLDGGLNLERMICHQAPGDDSNPECRSCGIRDYCMTWCGCTNHMASGYYNRVSPFICHAEKTAISVAFHAFQVLEKELGPSFCEHVSGHPAINSLKARRV